MGKAEGQRQVPHAEREDYFDFIVVISLREMLSYIALPTQPAAV
jgi:hypothetical protein